MQRERDAVDGLQLERRREKSAGYVERHGDVPRFEQGRRVVRHRLLPPFRLGGEQHLRVGVGRTREDARHRPLLHHLPSPHDIDAVGEPPHDAEIVGDEDDRHAEARLQLFEQIEDLRLDGHVERGGRLVGDQHVRIVGERHRDHDALPLAAGELVRIGADAPFGVWNLHQPQQLDRFGARLGAAQAAMLDQRLGDLVADLVERIERGHRLLKDHGDLGAADPIELPVGRPRISSPR